MDQTTSPSSYTYKDRLKLKAQDGHSYNQWVLYSAETLPAAGTAVMAV